MPTKNFQLVVDGVPYEVRATPFEYNGETRFKVAYNNEVEYIFTWDTGIGQFTAIDEDSHTMPDTLEQAIAAKLQSKFAQPTRS
jgi:hypothetical protein